MKTIVRATVIVVWSMLLGGRAEPLFSAQLSNAPVNDQVIAIGVIPNVPDNVYAKSTTGLPVFYVGDEVQLAVRLANGTDAAIALGEEPQSWVEELRIRIVRQQVRGAKEVALISAQARIGQRGRIALPPRGSMSDQITLRTDTGELWPVGTFTIEVDLPTLERAGRGEKISRREVSFEVREATTREDTLDQYLHRSYRAQAENRPQDERAWLQRVLDLHPNSLIAWTRLASMHYREGDCKAAVPALRRALELSTLQLDGELLRRDQSPDTTRGLQQRLQKCGVAVQ